MGKILIIDERKLVNQINYLTELRPIGRQNEDSKNEAINQLNRIFTMSSIGITGLLIEKSKLEFEMDWLDKSMARHDELREFETSEKFYSRYSQLEWIFNSASEESHPSETSVNEIFTPEDVNDWSLSSGPNPSWNKKAYQRDMGIDDDYPDFPIH
jgi:hypothetical protein